MSIIALIWARWSLLNCFRYQLAPANPLIVTCKRRKAPSVWRWGAEFSDSASSGSMTGPPQSTRASSP